MLLKTDSGYIIFGSSILMMMKKNQHITIAMAIMACWIFLAIAFSVGKRKKQILGEEIPSTTYSVDTPAADEIASPFSLKAVSTFLLQ